MIKHHDQKKPGGKGFISAYRSISASITEGSQARNSKKVRIWRQELLQRPWKSSAYWLALHDLHILSPPGTQDPQSRDSTAHTVLANLNISSTKKRHHRLAYRPVV